MLTAPVQRLKEVMTTSHLHLHTRVPAVVEAARLCRTDGCELPRQGHFGFCEPCQAVYGTAALLYQQLLERETARIELEHPGLLRAADRALQDARDRSLPPETATHATAVSRGVLWQQPEHTEPCDALLPLSCEVARLAAFIGELRSVAIRMQSA